MNKDFWKGFFVAILLMVYGTYSSYRIYWLAKTGIKYFRWHALLWLYFTVALFVAVIGFLIYKNSKFRSESVKKILLVCCGLFIAVYTGEILLRILGKGRTYSEAREGVFIHPGERLFKKWYTISPPNDNKILASGNEYSFQRKTNSEGLSDVEWHEEKDSNEIRILALGDSFTEGDGCRQDSSYPSVLAALLQEEFPQQKMNVLNAGQCGSDPWFEYKKLNDLLLKYHPDIVIYTNGLNDLYSDHLDYGGMERFASDSSVKNKIPKHSWIGLYEVSYVFRLMMQYAGYRYSLFGPAGENRNKVTAIADSRTLSAMYNRLAEENQFTCVQMVWPDKFEIEAGKYIIEKDSLSHGTEKLSSYSTFFLLDYYRDSLQINKSNVNDYYWPIDRHHNAKGYNAMAHGVFSFIKPKVQQKIKEKQAHLSMDKQL